MTDDPREKVEQTIRDCYASWSETYYRDWYQDGSGPYPPHVRRFRQLIEASGARTLLDAGCGPAAFLRCVVDLELDCYGFDLTPEMVDEARKILVAEGQDPNQVWTASILEGPVAKGPSGEGLEAYDAVISAGVIPHIPGSEDLTLLENLVKAARPGGMIAIQGRNQLFSLFTANRYSRDFLFDELVDMPGLLDRADGEAGALKQVISDWEGMFRTDLPPLRPNEDGAAGYDEVLSRTHNPLTYQALACQAGLRDISLHYCNYHVLPPMFSDRVPELFQRETEALEAADDWRGLFMASSFILVGYRRED